MNGFTPSDATLRGGKCHTSRGEMPHLGHAEVWHSGCRSVAFQPGCCFGLFCDGGCCGEVQERVVSFQKALLSGRGGGLPVGVQGAEGFVQGA